MLDEHRSETFLVLDFHAVENAAIGIDADKEFPRGFEIAEDLGGVHAVTEGGLRRSSRQAAGRRLQMGHAL
jgi:hypothetical protein